MRNVLLVFPSGEQDPGLKIALEQLEMSVSMVNTVREALTILRTCTYWFLIFDHQMESSDILVDIALSGLQGGAPFLIAVGNFSSSESRIHAFNIGIDAFLPKPVDAAETCALIRAVLRRSDLLENYPGKKQRGGIAQGGLVIDPLRRSVSLYAAPVRLTRKEFDILYLLASYPGIVFTKDEIFERVWDIDAASDTTAVVEHVSTLRHKLAPHAQGKQIIQTVFGVGYKFLAA